MQNMGDPDHRPCHRIDVSHITTMDVYGVTIGLQVLLQTVREIVEYAYGLTARHEFSDNIRPDESGASGD